MNRPIPTLSAILAVQIVLAVVLLAARQDIGAYASDEKLMGLDMATIEAIRIEEKDLPPMLLKKESEAWVLPDHYGFPAASDKVGRLVEELTGLTRGWPVAATAASAKHFHVDDEAFERKISLLAGDEAEKTLILGTSPGLKKVHARVQGEAEVYAITLGALSPYEAASAADNWTDRQFLRQSESDIVRAELPDLVLVRDNGELTLEAIEEGEVLEPHKARELLGWMTGLSFVSVLGTEEKPEYGLDNSVFQYTLKPAKGEPVTYRFGKLEGEDNFVLKSDAHPYYFKIGQHILERIMARKREDLLQAPEMAHEPGEELSSKSSTAPD